MRTVAFALAALFSVDASEASRAAEYQPLDVLATSVSVYNTAGASAASIEGVLSSGGPTLEAGGVAGRLVVSNPDIFACNGVASSSNTLLQTVFMAPNGVRPIALIERSSPELADTEQCTFEEKVRAVQAAGAVAAVVFDYKDEGPLVMSYPHPDEVQIPAVFISHAAGVALVEAMSTAPTVHPITVLSAGFNNGQQAAVAAADAAAWYSLNVEFLSISTGYTFLFLLLIPVGIYNMMVALRRRRKVEAIYSKIYDDDELKGKLLAHLLPGSSAALASMTLLPLPLPLHKANQQNARCLRVHAFLVLVFLCFVYQVMLESMIYDAGDPSAVGRQGETRDEAVASGYAMVINAVVMALAILGIRILVCCACQCASSVCNRNGRRSEYPGAASTAAVDPKGKTKTKAKAKTTRAGGVTYVELPSGSTPVVHAGVPVELSIQEDNQV